MQRFLPTGVRCLPYRSLDRPNLPAPGRDENNSRSPVKSVFTRETGEEPSPSVSKAAPAPALAPAAARESKVLYCQRCFLHTNMFV